MTTPARPWTGLDLPTKFLAGFTRLRFSSWSLGQSAVAAASGWLGASYLWHHPAPIFAAVAGIVCLGTSHANRLRRVVELGIGVSIGVGVGDLVVGQIGHGAWQLAVVCAVAMSVAVVLDGGGLLVSQAGIQAVFVVALAPPPGGNSGRWLDALVGAGTALAIAFIAPADPKPALRREIKQLVEILADALQSSADACQRGDPEGAADALEAIRSTQPVLDRWATTIEAAAEIVRISYWRRRTRRVVSTHQIALVRLDHAVRNLRVAVRRLVAATEDAASGAEAPIADPVLQRLRDLARALHTLPALLLDPEGEGGRRARAALTTLATRLDPVELGASTLSSTVVVGQLRSAVIDLVQIAGVSFDEARTLMR